ncbi:hypothetical protein [Epibacterium sp. Ofav1-8]|nr:hypothetical protein [Epibacterium sp. Ofav1-8]MCG7625097.1 hypothetical protein [Epibacterium sp. Ofav1-8]
MQQLMLSTGSKGPVTSSGLAGRCDFAKVTICASLPLELTAASARAATVC